MPNDLRSTLPAASEIEKLFQEVELTPSARAYIRFHQQRYHFLLKLIAEQLETMSSPQGQILDIGPAYQTFLLRKFFSAQVINTLGFHHPSNLLRDGEKHFSSNLNESKKTWPALPHQDLILFCEVIEHLYCNPKDVLQRLADTLQKGGRLIIQTPNAVAIHKRLRMLVGQNPFQLLQDNKMGHFREYTASELKEMLDDTGLEIISIHSCNYFNYPGNFLNHVYQEMQNIMPRSWRDGLTIVARKIQQ